MSNIGFPEQGPLVKVRERFYLVQDVLPHQFQSIDGIGLISAHPLRDPGGRYLSCFIAKIKPGDKKKVVGAGLDCTGAWEKQICRGVADGG